MRRPGLQLRQRGGDVDGDGRRADAALRAQEREHFAVRAGASSAVTRVTAAVRSGAVTGAVRNSVTPARMASSISAGSSAAATITTPVVGC